VAVRDGCHGSVVRWGLGDTLEVLKADINFRKGAAASSKYMIQYDAAGREEMLLLSVCLR
jgi:hypothetical protein